MIFIFRNTPHDVINGEEWACKKYLWKNANGATEQEMAQLILTIPHMIAQIAKELDINTVRRQRGILIFL